MRVLIIGAGATGGYYGARMAHAGRDVTFLVRTERAAQLRARGMHVVSPHGNISLEPKLVTAADLHEPYDIVLITVKAYGLTSAMADMKPAVGPGTMIVPTLNGMRHVSLLQEQFGPDSFVGGVCRIAATIDEEGTIVQLNRVHDLIYGEMSSERTERIVRLDETFRNCGFEARLSDSIEQEMWDKWILLASLAGITCCMRGTIGEVAQGASGLEFANGLMDEIVSVASAAGHHPSEVYVDDTRRLLTQQNSQMTASMYRDLTAGKSVEADHILGDLLVYAKKHNVTVPFLTAAYASLDVYQRRLCKTVLAAN